MKKKYYWFMIVFIFTLFITYSVSLVSATPTCRNLPSYVNEFKNYYENVELTRDNCYPSFSFTTPRSYSKFNVPYKVNSNTIPYSNNITDFDSKLREEISRIENCSGFEKYVELRNLNDDPISPNAFTSDPNNPTECSNLQSNINYLDNIKIVNTLLSEYKGDYSFCKWDGSSSSRSNNNWDMYITCDDTREFLVLVLDGKDNITEAYFANSASEFYRKIYPEDVKIMERSPAWERSNLISSIFIAILIISALVIVALLFYFIKKRVIKH